MKTVGSCSIDELDSKNDFGVSAPRGKNRENGLLPDFQNFRVILFSFLHVILLLIGLEI